MDRTVGLPDASGHRVGTRRETSRTGSCGDHGPGLNPFRGHRGPPAAGPTTPRLVNMFTAGVRRLWAAKPDGPARLSGRDGHPSSVPHLPSADPPDLSELRPSRLRGAHRSGRVRRVPRRAAAPAAGRPRLVGRAHKRRFASSFSIARALSAYVSAFCRIMSRVLSSMNCSMTKGAFLA